MIIEIDSNGKMVIKTDKKLSKVEREIIEHTKEEL